MMSGLEALDERRRRARFRAWHRGTREMDIVMGRFVDAEIASFNDAEMDELERLIDMSDPVLYAWITGEQPLDPAYDTPFFRRWQAFHRGN